MFIDIVGYSKLLTTEQIEEIQTLKKIGSVCMFSFHPVKGIDWFAVGLCAVDFVAILRYKLERVEGVRRYAGGVFSGS